MLVTRLYGCSEGYSDLGMLRLHSLGTCREKQKFLFIIQMTIFIYYMQKGTLTMLY